MSQYSAAHRKINIWTWVAGAVCSVKSVKCSCSYPPLVLAGCRKKPCPVLLAEVDDFKRKNVTGRCLLCCSHHSVGKKGDKCRSHASIHKEMCTLNRCRDVISSQFNLS